MRSFYNSLFVLLFPVSLSAQDSSRLDFSGYIEAYYQYDGNKPPSKDRPWFLYNHKRNEEFNINLAVLKAAYTGNRVRASLALMAGNYPQYNLAAEPGLLQQVMEANIGYAFSDKWSMDAGILPSHIGFETAISKDCWNLSRSLLAENSPYYETGVKLNYTPNTKWSAAVLLLNGWQHIRETNSGKAVGLQLQFKPNEKWLFNYSNFLGNEKPDTVRAQTRFFHNFYMTGALTAKLNAALLFDIGTENASAWYGAALQLQYGFSEKFRLGARTELYKDQDAVIITSPVAGGFNLRGFSLNIDLLPQKQIAFRAEARCLQASTRLFEKNGVFRSGNFSVLGSVAVSF